jgi:hypothetical protein
MIKLFFVFLLLLVSSAQASEEKVTPPKILSQKETDLLLGHHLFTTQTVSKFYIYFGEAHIENKDGVYYLRAKHKRTENSEIFNDPLYITMKGSIPEISNLSFKFEGEIELFYPGFMDKPCIKEGVFQFSRKNHPQYWRYKIQCPAHDIESFIEYIDIFVKQ